MLFDFFKRKKKKEELEINDNEFQEEIIEIEEGEIVPSSIDVEVVADEPGKEYNIGPTTFSIPGFKGSPKYEGFYGKSTKPMTGGLIHQGKVVSEEDVARAETELKEALLEEAQEELKKQKVILTPPM